MDGIAPLVGIYTHVNVTIHSNLHLSCQPNTSLAPPGRGRRPGGRRQAARPVPEEVQAPGARQVRGTRCALAARHLFTVVIPKTLYR